MAALAGRVAVMTFCGSATQVDAAAAVLEGVAVALATLEAADEEAVAPPDDALLQEVRSMATPMGIATNATVWERVRVVR